jgi:hypothetical protein
MNLKPQASSLKPLLAAITGIACIAVFISQVEAQNAPNPPEIMLSPSVQPRPAPNGEARLDAMGPTDTCREMRPITAVETNIGVKSGPGERPEDVGLVCHPAQAEPVYAMTARQWAPTCYCWEAPSLCYGPLYFEETNLERYGYSQKYLRAVQPLVSSAHFFGTVAMLPYLEIVEPPRECVYTLGQYRPGDCVPFQWDYPYFSPCARWPLTCEK